MSRTYREDRQPYDGDTRRFFLDPLKVDGIPVTTLDPGDSITWTLRNAAGSTVSSGSATYDEVFFDDNGRAIKAWGTMITFPTGGFASGKTTLLYNLQWTCLIAGATQHAYDTIQVQKSPY